VPNAVAHRSHANDSHPPNVHDSLRAKKSNTYPENEPAQHFSCRKVLVKVP
jgi:hypothetical protein